MTTAVNPTPEQRKRRSIVLALIHVALAVGVLALFVYMQAKV
ncbi:MAG: hypothetical protein ACREUE_03915 [Panacagrimonas sp.]